MLQALLSIDGTNTNTNETTTIGHTHDAATGFATAANPPTDGPSLSYIPTIPPTRMAHNQITFRRLPARTW